MASAFARSPSQLPRLWVSKPARRGRTKPATTSSGTVRRVCEAPIARVMAATTAAGE